VERPHLATLRVEPLEDLLDGAVLTAGVYRLQHDQQASPVLPVQPGLHIPDPFTLHLQLRSHLLVLAVPFRVRRIHLG
jgi:hypothetical protein